MKYCKKCLYPINAKPTIIFDDDGVCSGCRYHESRVKLEIDWKQRKIIFEQIIDEARKLKKIRGNSHDCIVPVSGGKDSHYQVWLLKKKYGLNPLLVTFNHAFNTSSGLRNLENLIEKSGCDAIRYSAGLDSVYRISSYMLKEVGDITWHYHAGIRTFPFQIAVKYNIPLVIWGEHGFAELTGIVSLEDFVEHTRWTRKEHDMRGYEPETLIGKNNITRADIAPYIYPSEDEIENTEVRGIYLSNFFDWNAKSHAELMMREWQFSPITFKRDRTFNLYSKIEDHANDVHDYLKYLKFGYGRATDDASMEIRHGRLTREKGIQLVQEYDSNEPSTLEHYCDFLEITKTDFYKVVENQRDPEIWQKNKSGEWEVRDAVWFNTKAQKNNKKENESTENSTFSEKNRQLYFNPNLPPLKFGDRAVDEADLKFRAL